MNSSQRMYDLDWLRVIAIILVLYFHVAMIFTSEWDWHIKNTETSNLWLEFNFWLSQFRMPLLFFISGAGSFFALSRNTSGKYLSERSKRLLVPLLFSMFVVVPPQIFFERLFEGETFNSFLDFYPSTFSFIPYPEGNISWHHMWFVLYLFVYSLVGLPIFLWLKSEKGQVMLHKLSLSQSVRVYWLILPTILLYAFYTSRFNRTNDLVNDWGWLPYWFSFFLVGYLIACQKNYWESLKRNRQNSLKMAVACILLLNYFRWNDMEPWLIWGDTWRTHWQSYFYLALYPLDAWSWLLALVGYGRKYLNRPSKFLNYANEAIYPFYILHQTVIIAVGFYVIQVEESILAKYIFISTVSLFLTIAIYDFCIRPYGLIRFLFGMKSNRKKKEKLLNSRRVIAKA